MTNTHRLWLFLPLLALGLFPGAHAAAPPRRVLLIAGAPSHGAGEHRFPAGCELLAEALNRCGLPVVAEVVRGWPENSTIIATADLVVLYSDGLGAHVARGHAAELNQRLAAGKNLAVFHFALEPPEDDPALARLLDDAIGGRFEAGWSVNPVWRLQAAPSPGHPASRGVTALDVMDEWYFHLRLREGVQPLLAASAPPEAVQADGLRSGNPAVRAALARGEAQLVAWTWENGNGSRGFGFTGGHFHERWYDDNYRRFVVNGLVWAAGLEVPAGGTAVPSPTQPLFATLDEAIVRGDLADVRRQLGFDAGRIHGLPGAKLSPLQQAILRKKTAIALLLLEHGADVQAPESAGRTPLHLAVERGDATVLAALLARGADPGRRDRTGWTPLHHAAAKNQLEIARLILAAGLDPNVRSARGGTPLHEAAASGGTALVQLLLDHGTDPAIRSNTGVTALDIAHEYHNTAAIAVLEGRAVSQSLPNK